MITFIKHLSYILILLLLGVGVATAQSYKGNKPLITVSGKVVSATDGQPIVGATVSYRDDSNGKYVPKTVSDYDGRFELDFILEDTLMVQLIGYKTKKILPSDDPILVRMEDDPSVVFGCPTIVQYPVSGVVLDEKGEPLIGAVIRIKDTKVAVGTDINGEFKISAQKGAVLEISYIGYLSQTKKVSIKKPMKIKMKPNPNVIICD
ncbi:MAG: carboxypeptidase-like regulatory domain-containing protein [Muribaculaceae bacterium]|nr:carboxypeptidase-like regulatory domain-containing protein [Muribaculaceae bacterium]